MEFFIYLIIYSISQVWATLQSNWPFLAISVVVAAVLKLYLDAEKVSAFLKRYRSAGVLTATTAAVATPLCSCGTTAVILGMMASMMPWAPIIAFMVASPLTSPEELFYSAGLFGWPFALAFFISSILLGLAGGAIAAFFESRGWLNNQARLTQPAPARPLPAAPPSPSTLVFATIRAPAGLALEAAPAAACCQAAALPVAEKPVAPAAQPAPAVKRSKVTLNDLLKEMVASGKRLLVMFLGFAFIGYFINGLIPASLVATVFGSGNLYSVPLAATLGLPLYINTEASLPLIRALLDAGMSQGSALAFLISGSGTSIGAIAGAMTIARWRVVALVVGILWLGAIILGYSYNLLLGFGLF